MEIYINGAACISAQESFPGCTLPEKIHAPEGDVFRLIEPEYKNYIAPAMIRRMGRISRMGISAAATCMKEAGLAQPDAILTGTGFGCFEDSEKFLLDMIEHREQAISPTSFIQSTHNTVGAQAALLSKCHAPNFTYSHRGFSLESALMDACLLIEEGEARNVLCGSADEFTAGYLELLRKGGYVKDVRNNKGDLFPPTTSGSVPGEGAAFFILSSEKNERSKARIHAPAFLYKPSAPEDLEAGLDAYLRECNLKKEDLSVVLTGRSGDVRFDQKIEKLLCGDLNVCPQVNFKAFGGEGFTSGGFAIWLALAFLEKGNVPVDWLSNKRAITDPKHILILNHYRDANYTFMLISGC